MSGMNAQTGRALSDIEHVRQSITDILTTPIGSRVMRREYGSLLPELIDHPDTPANRLRLAAATAVALMRWEPRLALSRVNIGRATADGRLAIELDGHHIGRDGALRSAQFAIGLGAMA